MQPDARSAATNEVERLRVELVRRDGQVSRLMHALAEIADVDYRGNRSYESVFAHRVLVEEGFRAAD